MFYLKKKEFLGIGVILGLIVIASLFGFSESKKRARDEQRNLDISAISAGLEKYKADYGYYPGSSNDGEIVACMGENTRVVKDKSGNPLKQKGANKYTLENLIACQWGHDALQDVMDINYPSYLKTLPVDPQFAEGITYFYQQKEGQYFVYASYETKDISDFSQAVKDKKIACGSRVCNVARTNGNKIVE
jgi:type II secretory pathway pseudopilin PulG